MGLKPGYKQTEVGVIPEEWEILNVSDLVTAKIIEKPLDGNHGNIHPKSSDYVSYGVPFVMANNVYEGRIDFENCKFITKARADRLQKGFARSGDVLLTHKGTVGNTAIVGQLSTDYIMLTPQVTNYRVRDAKKINNKFLRYYFDSGPFQSLFVSLSGGGTRAYLGIVRQLALPVVVPPIEEQRAIAAALSDVDALISAQDKLIAKKRDLKQAAMQQLLTGKQRLPGFHGEWEVIRFCDIADKAIKWSLAGGPFGSNLKTSDYVNDGVRIIQLQNIGDGRFHDDYAIYTSEEKANELLSNNIYPGEIILSKMGDPVARACLVPEMARRYLMASDGIRLAVDRRRFDARFVHDYINSPYFRKKAIDASTGSTRQRIGLTELKRLPFVAPSLGEQSAIAAVLSDMDAEIAALEQKRDKTRLLKQGMMQELLTGKTRLVA